MIKSLWNAWILVEKVIKLLYKFWCNQYVPRKVFTVVKPTISDINRLGEDLIENFQNALVQSNFVDISWEKLEWSNCLLRNKHKSKQSCSNDSFLYLWCRENESADTKPTQHSVTFLHISPTIFILEGVDADCHRRVGLSSSCVCLDKTTYFWLSEFHFYGYCLFSIRYIGCCCSQKREYGATHALLVNLGQLRNDR